MSTTTLLRTAIGCAFATLLTGCAALGVYYPFGSIYQGTQIPHYVNRQSTQGPGTTGDKVGESCATGILFAVAFGDASLDAAKKVGGISEVHSVEFHGTSILGLYTQGCTEVHGK
jgi:hypothetical protein